MGMASEILSLRRNQTSSVRRCSLPSNGAVLHRINILQGQEHMRRAEAADIVLLNVAAHAAEALSEQPTIRRARRAALPSRRNLAGS